MNDPLAPPMTPPPMAPPVAPPIAPMRPKPPPTAPPTLPTPPPLRICACALQASRAATAALATRSVILMIRLSCSRDIRDLREDYERGRRILPWTGGFIRFDLMFG